MSSSSSSSSSTAPEPTWRRKSVPRMSSSERLASLKEWAEEKKYVRPGEGGTLMDINQRGGFKALAYGGSMPTGPRNKNGDEYAGQYEAPVGPPSYGMATREEGSKKRRSSVVGKWLDRRREKKEKAVEGGEKAPEYEP